VANPIYREVIVRVLGTAAEANIVAEPRSFVQPDGRLDFSRLLTEFVGFWRQHGEVLTRDGHQCCYRWPSGLRCDTTATHVDHIIRGEGYDRSISAGRFLRGPRRLSDEKVR
jgi:hypothetical protein